MSSIVAGTIIDGSEIKTTTRRKVVNPANWDEVVGEVSMVKKDEVERAITSAANAFRRWSYKSIGEKKDMACNAVKKLKPKIEELTTLFVKESGKTLEEARIDVKRSVQVLEEVPKGLQDWYTEIDLSNVKQQVKLFRKPRGVTTIITPWNSPVILTIKRVVPAIMTGNTVVVKPATNCPLTISKFLKVIAECFPPGVINIVTGSGQEIGDTLITNPHIRTISFVGGTHTGKRIMKLVSPSLKRLHLELGGNDPAIVLGDALLNDKNITKLKNGVLKNAGQVCSAIKRIYVHESKYDELIHKLGRKFNEVIVGNGIDPDSMMGAMNNEEQLNYVTELIEETKASGGNVRVYGNKLDMAQWNKGYFMLPAIVTNITQNSRIVQEEQFGPVVPILKFSDFETVIDQANDSVYGLRASIWTEDINRAVELSKHIEAGAIFFNNHTVFTDLRLDFPGAKESGYGNETIYGGFEHFTDSYGFAN